MKTYGSVHTNWGQCVTWKVNFQMNFIMTSISLVKAVGLHYFYFIFTNLDTISFTVDLIILLFNNGCAMGSCT